MQRRLIAMTAGLLLSLTAYAQENKDSDKIDIKKLEDKYWSAKDDDFSVVQNRSFEKAGRFYLVAMGGIPINSSYNNGTNYSLGGGYHFSERYGVELSYLKANYNFTDDVDGFIKEHGTIPNQNVLRERMTAQFNYVPFYAKMSFLDKKIIYFDMGVGLGVGQTTFEQYVVTGNRTATAFNYSLSLYQNFFFSEHFAFKVDYRNTWTTEERFRYKIGVSETEDKRSLGNRLVNDTELMFGLMFFY